MNGRLHMQRSCPKCGFDLGDNLRYCDNCGHVLWTIPQEEKNEESIDSLIISKPDDIGCLDSKDEPNCNNIKKDTIRAAIQRANELEDAKLLDRKYELGDYAKEKLNTLDLKNEAARIEKRNYNLRFGGLIVLTFFIIFILIYFFSDSASRSDIITNPLIFQGKVYYASTSDNSRLYSINLDGTQKTRLSDLSIDSVSVSNDTNGKLIVAYSAPGFGIYRRENSNKKTMLFNNSASELYSTDTKLYFIPDFNGEKQLSYVDYSTYEVYIMSKKYADNLIYTSDGFLYRNISMNNEIWVNSANRDKRVMSNKTKGFAYNSGYIYFINSLDKNYIYSVSVGDLSKEVNNNLLKIIS